MRIYKEKASGYNYAFDFDFNYQVLDLCRFLKNEMGYKNFGFDPKTKKWRFNNLSAIDHIKSRYPLVEVTNEVEWALTAFNMVKEKELDRVLAGQKIKEKEDSDIKVKGLKGELFPYQKVGVEFFVNNKGRAILADTMGLGKSLQALAYIVHIKAKRSLIVCPASVKYSWEKEIKKWTDLKFLIVNSKMDLAEELKEKPNVLVINYDILERFYEILVGYGSEVMVVDEFHYIKSNTAKRTRVVKALSAYAPSVLLLSGTPLLSRPVELFNGLNIMDPTRWNNWLEYTRKYCGGHSGYFGWDAKGATNVEELKSRISRYFLRRRKDEVLLDLPPKRYIDVPVEIDTATRKEYEMALYDFKQYLKKVKKKTDKQTAKTMQAEKLVKLGALRQLTTTGKIEIAYETIKNIIDSGEKVVVFSVYNKPIIELAAKLGEECVILLGDTLEQQRKEVVDKFQDDPKVKVFLGGLKSAGVGITLTSGQNVLFIDYSWVPADHDQAQDRIHRIGQKADSVSIYQLYARNTIDDYMRKILAHKKKIFDQIIDGKESVDKPVKKEKSLVKELLSELEKSED